MTRLPEVEQAVFLRFPPEAELPAGKVVLDLHVPELLAGERRLSRDIRLRVMGGEKVGIVGPNGRLICPRTMGRRCRWSRRRWSI